MEDRLPDFRHHLRYYARDRPPVGINQTNRRHETSPKGDALAYRSDASGKSEAYVVPLTVKDGRPAPGSNRERVAVEGVVAMDWGLEGDELFALTSTSGVFSVPVERRDGRVRVGEPVKLFELPAARTTNTIGVTPGGDKLIFPVDPEAECQTLSVLLDWPVRLGASEP